MGKGINIFVNQHKLYNLGPHFAAYRERNSATSPDMIFANNKAYHNLKIEPGPFTISDHLPVICIITSKPITTPTTPIYNTTKANWEKFTNITESKIKNITCNEHVGSNTLEEKFKEWHDIITDSMKESIPTKTTYLIQ